MEELGQQEERRALVEAVARVVYEGTATAREVVLLEDRDGVSGFGESSCGRDAAYSCACLVFMVSRTISESSERGRGGGRAYQRQWQSSFCREKPLRIVAKGKSIAQYEDWQDELFRLSHVVFG